MKAGKATPKRPTASPPGQTPLVSELYPIATNGAQQLAETRETGETPEEFHSLWAQRAEYLETRLNGKRIDWRFWFVPYRRWTAAEASRLLVALDPKLFADLSARPHGTDHAKLEAVTRKAGWIQARAESVGQGDDCMEASPEEWHEWARARQIPMHTLFLAALSEFPAKPILSRPQTDAARQRAARQPPERTEWWDMPPYDIHELAEQKAMKLIDNRRKPSASKVSVEIAKHINAAELTRARQESREPRKPISSETLRTKWLIGWKFQAAAEGSEG